MIDNKLKYNAHLTSLRSKLSNLRYITYKIRPLINVGAAKKFYYAMVESKLSYAILVWAGTHIGSATFAKLCRLQNKIIFNLFATVNDSIDNVSAIYKRQNILKLPDLYKLRVSITVYKVLNENYAPFIFDELMSLTNENHYNLRHQNSFVTPFPRVNTIKVNFIFNAVKIWNELTNDIKQSQSAQILKHRLKDKYVNNY